MVLPDAILCESTCVRLLSAAWNVRLEVKFLGAAKSGPRSGQFAAAKTVGDRKAPRR